MKSRKIDFVAGDGTFVAPNAIDVDGERYVGKKVVLATGSYARTLPGLEIGGRIITSTEALRLDRCRSGSSSSAAGSSAWSSRRCSRASARRSRSSRRCHGWCPNEDEFASKLLERAFRRRKITFRTGVRFTAAKQTEDAGHGVARVR